MYTNTDSKMEVLKRKNRRNNLVKQYDKYISITNQSFLEVSENSSFIKQVKDKLNTEAPYIEVFGKNLSEITLSSYKELEKIKQQVCSISRDALFLIFSKYEIEVIRVDTKDVFNSIYYLLEESRFMEGYSDFILVGKNLEFGTCVMRGENYYEIYRWGI